MTRYTWHDEPVVRPTLFVVPAGEVTAPTTSGYTVRVRGDRDGTVVHQYRCPVHGLFDARVPRGAVPDGVKCPVLTTAIGTHVETGEQVRLLCGGPSPWAGSLCGIGFAAGEVTG